MPKFVLQRNNTAVGDNTFTGTTTFTGAVANSVTTATTFTATGLTKTPNPVHQQTITAVATQNATPTIAQILGGFINHASVTGAGTATVPIGSAMSAGVSGVAVGSTIRWTYYNSGTQTVTITAAASHTLVGGTAAVTTGKWMPIISVCTATDTWVSYLTTLM